LAQSLFNSSAHLIKLIFSPTCWFFDQLAHFADFAPAGFLLLFFRINSFRPIISLLGELLSYEIGQMAVRSIRMCFLGEWKFWALTMALDHLGWASPIDFFQPWPFDWVGFYVQSGLARRAGHVARAYFWLLLYTVLSSLWLQGALSECSCHRFWVGLCYLRNLLLNYLRNNVLSTCKYVSNYAGFFY